MQAHPKRDHVFGSSAKGGSADPSSALNRLPEYAYRAAILVVMVLLLWTVA